MSARAAVIAAAEPAGPPPITIRSYDSAAFSTQLLPGEKESTYLYQWMLLQRDQEWHAVHRACRPGGRRRQHRAESAGCDKAEILHKQAPDEPNSARDH